MPPLFGALGLQDTDYLFSSTAGQQVVYDESTRLLDQYNDDLDASLRIFVQEPTEKFKERYKLPGNGELEERGRQSKPGAVKADGNWDVAYPLKDYAALIVGDDVTMAYMTLAQYRVHFETVLIRDANTVRRRLLSALLNNAPAPFKDEINGDLTLVPLANNDAVLYPPVLGGTANVAANHYLESNYAASGISDTNNPIATLVDLLKGRFGTPTGGPRVAVFIPANAESKVKALTDFVELPNIFVAVGTQTATVRNIPEELMAGSWEIIGTCSGAIVCVWRFLPSNYLIGVHLDSPPPLKMRVDPAATGLGRGLQLVQRRFDAPFEESFWRHRFGFGVGNRLSAAVLELGTAGSYTVPAGYDG